MHGGGSGGSTDGHEPTPPPPGNEPPSDVDSRRRTRQGHPRPLGRRQLRSHAHLGRRYDEHCPGKKPDDPGPHISQDMQTFLLIVLLEDVVESQSGGVPYTMRSLSDSSVRTR